MQTPDRIRRIGDQAHAERASGVIDPNDAQEHAYLRGIEHALHWAAGGTPAVALGGLISRADEADADSVPAALEDLAVELEEATEIASPAGLAARVRDIAAQVSARP